MHRLLIRTELQKELDDRGFVQLPLLSSAETRGLLLWIESVWSACELQTDAIRPFHSTICHPDFQLRHAIHQEIRRVLMPRLAAVLTGFRFLAGLAMVKRPGPGSYVEPHVHVPVIDQQVSTYLTVFVPLINIDRNNGGLGFIHGSQNFCDPESILTRPDVYQKQFAALIPYLDIRSMAAGEALIFDHRTIHASPVNLSEKTRFAVTAFITDEHAQLYRYNRSSAAAGDIQTWAVDEGFFLRNTPEQLSAWTDGDPLPEAARFLEFRQSHEHTLTDSALLSLIRQHPDNVLNPYLAEHGAELFGLSSSPTTTSREHGSGSLVMRAVRNLRRRLAG